MKLSDPIRRFLPEWRDVEVSVERPDGSVEIDGGGARPLDPSATLGDLSRLLATEPLWFQSGAHWYYSWSPDICARLVEVIADEPDVSGTGTAVGRRRPPRHARRLCPVLLGPAATAGVGAAGDFMWGGAASTAFWIDPAEDLFAVFVTQLIPSGASDFRGQLRSLVHAAITD